MKRLFYVLCCCICYAAHGQTAKTDIAIIPEPVAIARMPGEFVLPKNISFGTNAAAEAAPVIAYFNQHISKATGASVSAAKSSASTISLTLNAVNESAIGNEGYRLTVTPKEVSIHANKPAGLFYGIQTLLQLLPKEIESATYVPNRRWTIPCVNVTDYPRFQWRGLMFDVSRHFFTKAEVKKYIDNMVRYKFNLLHMHLTDNEGWRIEIKSLPKLTEVGAWAVKKVGYYGTFDPPKPEEPRNYGGFYTQEDIKEIIKYAQDRYVNILPEIDVPGHSLAAIAAYPELSCTPEASTYHVRSGERIMQWNGPKYSAIIDNNLCPANENVYAFLDKVITEVAALFPFEYIHMGGDEAAKNFWEKSDAIKDLMKRENLKDLNEVQSYFEKRVEKIVESKGKKFMGWDEILEGGLAPNAMVMSWRGMQGGIKAAQMKHDVVMSPTTFAYIDYMQGDVAIEPRVYATLRLNKAYQFEPLPDSVDAKYIKGGQANLWTENVYNMRHAEYMTWPRGFAISESLWSPRVKKNWPDFFGRVEKHFQRFDVADVKYAPSVYDPIFNITTTNDLSVKLELNTEIPGLDIYYTFDNSFPDKFYPKYTAPLIVPKEATQLRLITYRGDKPIGRMITVLVEDLNKRATPKK
ncbi:family 20 glycosylhydrolase [Mucilaginibacter sp. PAMB04274]|uniref:beta-N-acetylhexosaminidase n=1 Tax=Mucilaginibacter sp. PAMB04274 TaxID=3138568 RepID=UPI0031F696EE